MKKIIITILTLLVIVSLIFTSYFYWDYKKLSDYTIQFIRSEAAKDHPELGYNFVIDHEGKIISHPLISWAINKNIVELFASQEKPKLVQALEEVRQKKELLIKKINDIHGHSLQLYLAIDGDHIKGLLFFPSELKKFNADAERESLISMSLSLLCALCALLIILGSLFIINHFAWWYIVILLSFSMLIEIGYIWSLRYSVGFQEEFEAVPILDQAQELSFIQKLDVDSKVKYLKVPTGIFIEQMQFSPRGNSIYPGIYLNGYIWQKYDKNKHADIEKGFTLSNAYSISINELYRENNDNEEIICWSFSCILYQRFKPTLYPFDHRHIIINLLHKNFEKNVALIPDLDSYELLNPLTLPGMAFKKMSYWNIINSFFSFKTFNFKTKLGSSAFNHNHVPYLQFLITVERKLGGDFLMYFIMMALVLIIIFVLLLAFLKQEALQELVGFSTMGVLSVCSSLLFVLVMSEIDLRHALVAEGILYFDFLYFVCYFAIIAVIINGILFATNGDLPIISYKNNLIGKLLYWPIILLFIVLITAYAFY